MSGFAKENIQVPLISVIIPTFNAENTVIRAVTSIQRQTYNNLEIIIINDGSTDRTKNVCEELAKTDSRITVLNLHLNRGISNARNTGIELSNGEYVAFLDSDDSCDADYISNLYQAIKRDNADMSICGYNSIYPNNTIISSYQGQYQYELLDEEETLKKMIKIEIGSHPWGKLYSKKIIKQVRYPEGLVYEDVYTLPTIIHSCKKIAIINDKLVNYYQNESSIVHIQRPESEYCAFDAGLRIFNQYKDQFKDLRSYMLYMPITVGLRLKIMCLRKPSLKKKINYKEICNFLKKVKYHSASYKNLNLKYKIALVLLG